MDKEYPCFVMEITGMEMPWSELQSRDKLFFPEFMLHAEVRIEYIKNV